MTLPVPRIVPTFWFVLLATNSEPELAMFIDWLIVETEPASWSVAPLAIVVPPLYVFVAPL